MSKEYQVPEGTNLFINDTPLNTELVRRTLNSSKTSALNFVVFDRQELTPPLVEAIETDLSESDSLAFIFPGEGSKKVQEVLPTQLLIDIASRCTVFNTNTKREFRGNRVQSVETQIPVSLIERINEGEIRRIRIIDDVVSSGQTVQSIRDDIRTSLFESQPEDDNYRQDIRFSFSKITIPDVSFGVFTWLQQKSANLDNLKIFASIVYFRRSGKVPLNSVSTILGDDEKSLEVKKSYGIKYFQNAAEFFDIVDRLKKYI